MVMNGADRAENANACDQQRECIERTGNRKRAIEHGQADEFEFGLVDDVARLQSKLVGQVSANSGPGCLRGSHDGQALWLQLRPACPEQRFTDHPLRERVTVIVVDAEHLLCGPPRTQYYGIAGAPAIQAPGTFADV